MLMSGNKSKKKIYILTNFSTWLRSYSPIIIVASQINMFKRAGYEPVLITTESWDPPEDSVFSLVETKRIPNVVIDGTTVDEAFEKDVELLYNKLDAIIEDESVVFTHDLIFLPDYVKHNVACRHIADERPSVQWIHLIHSATAPGSLIKERAMFGEKYSELLNSKFPNSIVMYPNAYDIPRVASNYSYEENEIIEVPHSTDPVEGMSRIVRELYDAKHLGEPEVLVIYPIRLDRGKYCEAQVYLMSGCKENQMSSHVIFCDFQSTGGDKVTYREDLKRLAKELEVEDRVTFLSEFDESASMEVPHSVILELLTLSNVFLMPSKSETYSLIAQEAMLKGNLCILNHDFAPFRQIYGKNALYKQFDGANIAFSGQDGEIITKHDPINKYYRSMASNIKYYLENEKVIRAKTFVRTQRNPDYVFKNYIEPLILTEQPDNAIQRDSTRLLGT